MLVFGEGLRRWQMQRTNLSPSAMGMWWGRVFVVAGRPCADNDTCSCSGPVASFIIFCGAVHPHVAARGGQFWLKQCLCFCGSSFRALRTRGESSCRCGGSEISAAQPRRAVLFPWTWGLVQQPVGSSPYMIKLRMTSPTPLEILLLVWVLEKPPCGC